MSAVGSLLAGVLLGIVGGAIWMAADLLVGILLNSLAFGVRAHAFFADWILPIVGLCIAFGAGYAIARVLRSTPMSGAFGVGVGLLAVFMLPQLLVGSDVSLYLAGPAMLIPTIAGLLILPLIGGRLGRRTT